MSKAPARDVTDEYYTLDINILNRAGILSKPTSGTIWSWLGSKAVIGGVQIGTGDDKLRISFRIGEWPKTQTIRIDRTRCHFGGQRPWFTCPGCSRRSGKLYGGYNGFLCRICLNLSYACQREDLIARLRRRISKLKSKVIEDDLGFLERPIGMHRKTFNRIKDEVRRLELLELSAIAERFAPET